MAISIQAGNYQISTVHDHVSPERAPDAVYKNVPLSAWEPYKSFALNENGKYRSIWRGHLIRPRDGKGPLILVDTGMGAGPHEHTGRKGQLLDSLGAEGVRPEDVGAVVITHCHGDHIGWNVTWDGATPRATFPNAVYHIAKPDWDHYTKPENKNEMFEKHVSPLEALGRLKLVNGEHEIAPGIRTLPAIGHTPGHQCVLVQGDEKTAVLTGDMFHNVAQVTEQTWCPVFDWNTDLSTASRQRVFKMAQDQGWIVCSGHLPVGRSMGRVVERDGKAAWDPVL